ncbi:MAG: efflux RND transporter periplasmic adaptor subunit [Deltaproteobacteria bacterium]|nr:efflux RND transporter periplasmic adaptor subunit [Deltaproteobacteria bacterium]
MSRLIGLVVLAGAVLGVILWAPWASGGPAKLAYLTVKVDKGSIAAKVTATGTLSPRNTVQVGAQVSGRVIELDVDFNDHVKKGQVIARLDPSVLAAQVTQVRAGLALARANQVKAEAQARDAQRQYDRQKALRAQDLNAVIDVEAAETTLDAAKASVVAAKAQVQQSAASLSQAETNVSYTTISSPVDGVVISRAVDVGQTVAASLQAPTLFTIAEDLALMQIDTSVAEGDIGQLKADMPVEFSVDAFPERTFTGKVRQIRNSPTTVSGVVTYNAVIDVANPDGALRPGMTANVTFVLAEVKDATRVAASALRFRPSPEALKVIFPDGRPGGGTRPAGAGGPIAEGADAPRAKSDKKTVWKLVNGQPVPVRVKVGLSDGSLTQITEGELAAGDELVTEITGLPASATTTKSSTSGKSAPRPPGPF